MQMLTRSPDKRINLDQVLNSDWIGNPDPLFDIKPIEERAQQVKSEFISS